MLGVAWGGATPRAGVGCPREQCPPPQAHRRRGSGAMRSGVNMELRLTAVDCPTPTARRGPRLPGDARGRSHHQIASDRAAKGRFLRNACRNPMSRGGRLPGSTARVSLRALRELHGPWRPARRSRGASWEHWRTQVHRRSHRLCCNMPRSQGEEQEGVTKTNERRGHLICVTPEQAAGLPV